MDLDTILNKELKGSFDFFFKYTNLDANSRGYGLTVDSTKKPQIASIAAVGFALTAWVIAVERGYLGHQEGLEITRKTLRTLLESVDHYHGFFAHYLLMDSGKRYKKCEFSTIDTALCLNGVITSRAYFKDTEIEDLAYRLLERVDWKLLVFERDGRMLFRMAYNPDREGDYVDGQPGFISQWDMAAEQKMMYVQSAATLGAALAGKVYAGFSRDLGTFDGQAIIINPGGSLFAYQFSEAWLDTGKYLDPDGVDWFQNTRLAALANRGFCMQRSTEFKTFHANSWGLSAGDGPWGYEVSGSPPWLRASRVDGTVSIYSALACLPFLPEHTRELILHLYHDQTQTWGEYGFFDAYNLDVSPAWYSQALYGIDKGCSMIMIENYLSRLVWETYTQDPYMQAALEILGFSRRQGA